MTSARIRDIALRTAVVCVAAAAIYWLCTHSLSPAAGVLMSVGGVILGRSILRTKLSPNPLGDAERYFQIGPVLGDLSRCAGCFAAGCVWAVLTTLAVKHQKLPDTYWTAYGVLLVPLVASLAAAAFFLGRAGLRAMFGMSKSR
jgi:hypothetical protein